MHSVEQLAWIQTPDALYYARCRRAEPAPTSAAIKLLQGIFDLHRDHSFFILRNRIGLSYDPELQDLGMIKLLAKRHFVSTVLPDLARGIEIGTADEMYFPVKSMRSSIRQEPGRLISDFRAALAEMEAQIPLTEVPHDSPRKIAAFALDGDRKLLAATAHSGVVNKSLHAEVCLVQDLHRMGHARFPQRGTLVVSMRPCRMCAGMIADFLPPGFEGKILYRDPNDGTRTRGSALDGKEFFRPL